MKEETQLVLLMSDGVQSPLVLVSSTSCDVTLLVLTVSGAVVPLAVLLLGHVELPAQADALLWRRLEEQDRKLPDAAPLTADELRRLQADLLCGVALCTCEQTQPGRDQTC